MRPQLRTWRILLITVVVVIGISVLVFGGFQSKTSIAWGNLQVRIREGETAVVVNGDQASAMVSQTSTIAELVSLPPIEDASSCLEIGMKPVMMFLACASEERSPGNSIQPAASKEDMALFTQASGDLVTHISVGMAVVEESPQLVEQLLSESWTVYSAVRKFKLSDVDCYGFTIQRIQTGVSHLELVGRCVTPNGPGFIWGSYSDISRLENFFLNR